MMHPVVGKTIEKCEVRNMERISESRAVDREEERCLDNIESMWSRFEQQGEDVAL